LADKLPLAVEQVGAHWGNGAQVDVAAINWRDKALLLGEAKWGTDAVGRGVIRELIEEKTPKVLASLPDAGAGRRVHHMFFARRGFTEAAQALAAGRGARLVDLAILDRDLTKGL
jgi:hypothetical protein